MATGSAVRHFPPSLNPPPLKLSPSVCAVSALITISGVSCGFQVSHFEPRHVRIDFRSEQQGRACCFEVCGQKERNPLLAPDRVRENGETNEQELASIELMMRCLLEKKMRRAGGRAHLAANPPRAAMPSCLFYAVSCRLESSENAGFSVSRITGYILPLEIILFYKRSLFLPSIRLSSEFLISRKSRVAVL